jgi:hypothetical protein
VSSGAGKIGYHELLLMDLENGVRRGSRIPDVRPSRKMEKMEYLISFLNRE